MKIGYPTVNLGLGCTSAHTFRLAALTEERFIQAAQQNLDCLELTLAWNAAHDLRFFRISSGLIPFASHPAMTFDWQTRFGDRLAETGAYIRKAGMRISFHPGQFVVLNSPSDTTYRNSLAELHYHAELLDLMGLDQSHKIQIHLGGLHGDGEASLARFAERYQSLPPDIQSRLVIENDERLLTVAAACQLHTICGIPVLFDSLHHELNNQGESLLKGLDMARQTWGPADGVPMIDYSNQNPDKKAGAHAVTLDVDHFRRFARSLKQRDIDIIFEIKNKEASALQAQIVLAHL